MAKANTKLKVYLLPNSDGIHSTLVAAKNQKEACELLGSTLGGFKAYGGHATSNTELIELAMRVPGQVWRRKLYYGPPEGQPDWELDPCNKHRK